MDVVTGVIRVDIVLDALSHVAVRPIEVIEPGFVAFIFLMDDENLVSGFLDVDLVLELA